MKKHVGLALVVPTGMAFEDLQLTRNADGTVSLDWDVIHDVLRASGLGAHNLKTRGYVETIVIGWYLAHLDVGGRRDQVADQLIAEIAPHTVVHREAVKRTLH